MSEPRTEASEGLDVERMADAFTWLHVRLAGICGESHMSHAREYAALAAQSEETGAPGHVFHDEWSFQRSMTKGNPVAGQPIAADQPCFDCGVPYDQHAEDPVERERGGFPWILIEREAEYVAIAEARLNGVQKGMGLDVPAPTPRTPKQTNATTGWNGLPRNGPETADILSRSRAGKETA